MESFIILFSYFCPPRPKPQRSPAPEQSEHRFHSATRRGEHHKNWGVFEDQHHFMPESSLPIPVHDV